ncbi:MAG: amino acid racemase [Pseudoflavonifractor sp.]
MLQEKTVGILGGMGPQATADFMVKIIQATHAKTDQDNIHMLVDCNPKVPPRVEAILHGGESSGPAMVEMALGLERAGADFLVIACNTAHYYYPDVVDAVHIPVLNLLELTAHFLREQALESVMILGTEALLRTELYHRALEREQIQPIQPPPECLKDTLEAIALVKMGRIEDAHVCAARVMALCEKQKVPAVILGCTELPIAFQGVAGSVRLFDPGCISAEVIVRTAKGLSGEQE